MAGWMPEPTLPRRTIEDCSVLPKIATRPKVEKVTFEARVGGSSASADNVLFPNISQPSQHERQREQVIGVNPDGLGG